MMIVLTAAILCLVIAAVSIKSEKSLVNPLMVFCTIWSIVLLFSSTASKLISCSVETYTYIIMGIFAFVAGYLFRTKIFKKRFVISSKEMCANRYEIEYVPRYQVLCLLMLVCVLFYAKDCLLIVSRVGLLSLGNIQKMLQSGELNFSRSSIENAIVILLVQPVAFAIPAVTAVDIWIGERNRKLFALTIIMLALRMIATANRTSIIMFFLFIVVAGCISLNQNWSIIEKIASRVRKYKRLIMRVLILAIVLFVFMTISRGASVFTNVFLDFAIPPRMFELWRESVDNQHLYGYGEASLMGFIFPVVYVTGNILKVFYPDNVRAIYELIELTDTTWVWPGKNIQANAYVSVFWFLYTDFRVAGIVIGMFLYGCVAASLYSITIKRKDAKHTCMYCILFYTLLYSFVRMQFSQSRIVLGLLFVCFFAYQKRTRIVMEG